MTKVFTLALLLLISFTNINLSYAQAPVAKPERQTTTQQKPKNKPSNTVPKQSRKQVVSGTINGHDYVDLGLSVKWATCNIGASKPTSYGDYYAWGETSTKSSYTDNNSKWYGVSYSDLRSGNVIDSNGNLFPLYDAARQNWGGSWRMPTSYEIKELIEKCTWKWISEPRSGYGNDEGYIVTGPNGNSIYLPARGYRSNHVYSTDGSGGSCWSATATNEDAYELDVYSDYYKLNTYNRYHGQSIRPVTN